MSGYSPYRDYDSRGSSRGSEFDSGIDSRSHTASVSRFVNKLSEFRFKEFQSYWANTEIV